MTARTANACPLKDYPILISQKGGGGASIGHYSRFMQQQSSLMSSILKKLNKTGASLKTQQTRRKIEYVKISDPSNHLFFTILIFNTRFF